MATKDSKLQNLLKFSEYQNLQGKQKATKKTEVGGFAVLEHHIVDKDGQIEWIKKNLDKCGKKKVEKIYKLVEKCVYKTEKKEVEESDESESKEKDESGADKK